MSVKTVESERSFGVVDRTYLCCSLDVLGVAADKGWVLLAGRHSSAVVSKTRWNWVAGLAWRNVARVLINRLVDW